MFPPNHGSLYYQLMRVCCPIHAGLSVCPAANTNMPRPSSQCGRGWWTSTSSTRPASSVAAVPALRLALALAVALAVVPPVSSQAVPSPSLDVANVLLGAPVWVEGAARGPNATCGAVAGDTFCRLLPDADGTETSAITCGPTSQCESPRCLHAVTLPPPVQLLEIEPTTSVGEREGSRSFGNVVVNRSASQAVFGASGGRVEVALIDPRTGPLRFFAISARIKAAPMATDRYDKHPSRVMLYHSVIELHSSIMHGSLDCRVCLPVAAYHALVPDCRTLCAQSQRTTRPKCIAADRGV